jgi:hypothetical protein
MNPNLRIVEDKLISDFPNSPKHDNYSIHEESRAKFYSDGLQICNWITILYCM